MSTSAEAHFSTIAEIARRMKTDKVHEYGDDPDESKSDLLNFCVGVREGRQLFLVYNGPGPYSARNCAYWSALFLSCDEIFSVADARMKSFGPEPDLDTPLLPKSDEQRETEFYANHPEFHPGSVGEEWERGEREGIQECIQVSRYPYIGPATIASYNYVRTGRRIVWGKVWMHPMDAHSGAIDDYVKEGYRKRRQVQPEINEMLAWQHSMMAKDGFPERERAYWTDRGMAAMVSKREGVFLVQYLGYDGLPEVIFRDGEEVDWATGKPV
jgi:hypothetical protein